MRRIAIMSVAITIAISGVISFQLVTEPRDIDVSDCRTWWSHGRVASVTCPPTDSHL